MAPRAAFYSAYHPVSSRHDRDLYHGMDEALRDDLILSPISWTKPPYQWCQGTSEARSPQPSRYLAQPLFERDALPTSGWKRSKKARNSLYMERRRDMISRKPASAFGDSNQARAGGTRESVGSNSLQNANKGGENFKWHFTVDIKDCSDVNVSIESNILTVEGNGFNSDCNYQKSVRYETTLPSHVRQDMLIAKLNKNRLTVVQKMVVEDTVVPIQVQEQRGVLAAEKKQQQQQRQRQQQQQPLQQERQQKLLTDSQ